MTEMRGRIRATDTARSGPSRSRARRALVASAAFALAVLAATAFGGPTITPPQTPAAGEDGSTRTAIFAGGCFWCMEKPFDELDGVLETTSGYTGGTLANPTYEQVSNGGTGHVEAVRVRYDPTKISYARLLDVFWRNVDPLDARGQFCDKGPQYTSAIFYADEGQKKAAEASKAALVASGRLHAPIVTRIEPAGPFYEAERYHQNYYRKNPLRYRYYRYACGRDQRLTEIWGDEAGGHETPAATATPAS